MGDIVSMVVVLCIILCGLSLIISPLAGKVDAFMLLRPSGRLILPLPTRITGGISRLFHKGAKKLWRAAPHQHCAIRLVLYPLSAVLGIYGWFFSVLAAICGEIFRPPKRRR